MLTPPEGAPEIEPDVLLVPLLAFDRAGYRLGYGGGFYDRTLEKRRHRGHSGGAHSGHPVLAIGSCFRGPGDRELCRADPFDQHLDWIVTEAWARKTKK